MYSTPVELSNSANSLKSLLSIRVLGKPLLPQFLDSGDPLFKRSGQPIITIADRVVKGLAYRDFFHW